MKLPWRRKPKSAPLSPYDWAIRGYVVIIVLALILVPGIILAGILGILPGAR